MGELRLSCFAIGENTMYTVNAITPLLNPNISDEEDLRDLLIAIEGVWEVSDAE